MAAASTETHIDAAVMQAPMAAEEGNKYFSSLLSILPDGFKGIKIVYDETGQKRMLAAKPFVAGELVLYDQPLVSMQTYNNKVRLSAQRISWLHACILYTDCR